MSLKPIKLYSHASGPNPWKVAILLEELGLSYNHEFIDFSKIKDEPYISVNPNGRVPAIDDPNTNTVLWESGAILQYLVETYDKDHKLSNTGAKRFQDIQWIMFQVSGQGPYYGQLAWFTRFHHEQLPSAIERYQKEAVRVVSVIDLHLTKTGQQYLTGDKCTYADLSFIPWAGILMMVPEGVKMLNEDGKFPKYKAWIDSLNARPAVKKVMDEKANATKH